MVDIDKLPCKRKPHQFVKASGEHAGYGKEYVGTCTCGWQWAWSTSFLGFAWYDWKTKHGWQYV